MDAARLIAAIRHALAQGLDARSIVEEAWQAHALAEAIVGLLARHATPEVSAPARALTHAAAHACDASRHPGPCSRRLRATGLTGVRDPTQALRHLLAILTEVGTALAAIACTTEEELVYWQCIDAVDATDE